MSNIDVRDLAKEELTAGQFPASPRADFRVFMTPEVHRGTWAHAKKNVTVEICGVLVGNWKHDENGPYAVATNFIPCENAASKFAEVTFTHESWALINREMDTKFANERIIGWYHSHPDFGIFLSDRDCFIQEHFFSGPGQIAYVIDPVRSLEGVFTWRAGKPTPLEHYWVGDTIRTVDASHSAAAEKSSRPHAEFPAEGLPPTSSLQRQSSFDLAATILSWLALFLLGYLVAGMQSRWEKEMIVEGTVAHYGYNKLMRLGLEDNLEKVRTQLAILTTVLSDLPESTEGLSEEELETYAKQRALVANNLSACEQMLGEIQQLYGYSDQERTALLQFVAQKQAQLRAMAEANARSAPKSGPAAAPPKAPVVPPSANSSEAAAPVADGKVESSTGDQKPLPAPR